MKIDNASTAWQSFTTAATEMIFVHDGAVAFDTEATEADRLGVVLERMGSVTIPTGKTVYYRLFGAASRALFARVAL